MKRKNRPLEARVTLSKLYRLYEDHGVVTELGNGRIVRQKKENRPKAMSN